MQVNHDVENQFAVSLVTPWIKGKMDVDAHNVIVDIPNTILFGLIPAGKRKYTTPIRNVSNVYTSSSYKLGRMALGAVIAFFGIATMGAVSGNAIVSLVMILLGAILIGSGILTVFMYENSGREVRIELPFFEANHAQEFADKVIELSNDYQAGLDNRPTQQILYNNQQANAAGQQAIVDAINNGQSHQQNQ